MYRVFLLCILIFAPNDLLARIALQVLPQVMVSGPRIVLGDIATIHAEGERQHILAQLPIAQAPPPGQSKSLHTATVIRALQKRERISDIDWKGSQNIHITREATRLSKKHIEAILGQFLQQNLDKLPKADIRLQLLRVPDEMVLPVGNVSWHVTPSRPTILGSTSFSIAFAVDGIPAGNCVVRCRLEALGDVVVAAMALQRGERLSQRSIRLEQRDLSKLDDPYRQLSDLIGKETLRSISAGSVLDHDIIGSPSLIHKGEMVTIIACKGSMQLTTKGVSRENGRKGEMIRVKNIGSKKMVFCRVERPGIVSVEF